MIRRKAQTFFMRVSLPFRYRLFCLSLLHINSIITECEAQNPQKDLPTLPPPPKQLSHSSVLGAYKSSLHQYDLQWIHIDSFILKRDDCKNRIPLIWGWGGWGDLYFGEVFSH